MTKANDAYREALAKQKKPPKYHNKKVRYEGFMFDSQREADRWRDLRFEEAAHVIGSLRRQVRYPLEVNGRLIATYVADFDYQNALGEDVTEDAKGVQTQVFRLKSKLFEAIYGRKIKLV